MTGRWQPSRREKTFLRFVRELARLMDVPSKEICLSYAHFYWKQKAMSAYEYFRHLVRGGMRDNYDY